MDTPDEPLHPENALSRIDQAQRRVREGRRWQSGTLVGAGAFTLLYFALLGWSAPSTADGPVEVVLTQDPDVVHRIARHLMRRLPPPGADNEALPPPTPGDRDDPGESADASGDGARSGWRGRLGRRP